MVSSNTTQNTKQAREDRLAARLRDNLRRRKKTHTPLESQAMPINKDNMEKEANHDR